MPDQFNSLNPLGLGQIEQQVQAPHLKEVNFTDLPSYVAAPRFDANLPMKGTDFISNLLYKPIDKSTLDSSAPIAYDNSEVAKFRNSTVWNKLGYNQGSNEEDRYDQAQPWWEAAKNSTIKLGLKSWDSFTSFFRQNVDTFNSLTKAQLESSWKNNANLAQLAKESQIDIDYPNFQSATSKPRWYSFIPGLKGSGEFYEQFVPQLGYTLGMMAGAVAENLVIDTLTGGVGAPGEAANTSRKVWGAITGFINLRRAQQALEAASAGKNLLVNGLKIGANGWAFYNTAASEAAMEGGTNYNDTKQRLVDDYKDKNGFMPGAQDMAKIEEAATSAGNKTFGMNLPVLLASNATQFGTMLFPSWAKSLALAEAEKGINYVLEGEGIAKQWVKRDLAARSFKEAWKGASIVDRTKLLTSYLMNEKAAFLSEGVEESLQRGISSGSQKYAVDKYNGKDKPLDAIRYGVSDMFTSDGAQEFIGGALGGLLFQGGEHLYTRKEHAANEQSRQDRIDEVVKLLNTEGLTSVLKDEGFLDAYRSVRDNAAVTAFSTKGDIYNAKNSKHSAFNNFMWTALQTGKIDLRITQLQDLKGLSDDELQATLVVEPTVTERKSWNQYIDDISADAKEWEQLYEKNLGRYDHSIRRAFLEHQFTKSEADKYDAKLKEKYQTDDLDSIFAPLRSAGVDLSQGDSSQLELEQDDAKRSELITKANTAYINYRGVTEASKTALFAQSDMLDSTKRGNQIIRELKKGDDYDFYLTEGLIHEQGLNETIKAQKEFVSNLDGEFKVKAQKRLEELQDILESVKNKEGSKKTAAKILDYVLNASLDKRKTEAPLYYKDGAAIRATRINLISDLLRLQERHQENLDLHNALENYGIGKHANYFSDKFKDMFIAALEKHEEMQEQEAKNVSNQGNNDIPADNQPQDINTDSKGNNNPQSSEPVKTEQPTLSKEDALVDQIRAKMVRGEDISEDEMKRLRDYSAYHPPSTKLYDSMQSNEEKAPFKEGDIVSYNDGIYTIDDAKKFEGKWVVFFKEDKGISRDASEVEKFEKVENQPVPVPTSYIPETEDEVAQLNIEEAEEITFLANDTARDANDSSRTIAQEVIKKTSSHDIPELDGGYVRFKQGFLDQVADLGNLSSYRGRLVLINRDNFHLYYSKDDPAYAWMASKDPKVKGEDFLVLTIESAQSDINSDKVQRFNDLYLPDDNGKPLYFSLVNGAYKTNLVRTMVSTGSTSIPVDLGTVSPGVLVRRTRGNQSVWEVTANILKDIPQTAFRIEVIKGPKDQKFEYRGANKLRNGGLYLVVKDAYVKLYPRTTAELDTLGVENFSIEALLDNVYRTEEEATKVMEFLTSLFYTNAGSKSLHFDLFRTGKGNKRFKIEASVLRAPTANETQYKIRPEPLNYSKQELIGHIKATKINISDSLLATNFSIYTIEGGNLVEHVKSYDEFVLRNTVEDKKIYSRDGQKVLKPINKYLTLSDNLENINNTLREEYDKKQADNNNKIEGAQPSVPATTRRRNRGDRNIDDAPLFSLVTNDVTDLYTPEEAKFFEKRFGKNWLELSKIANSKAWGVWTRSGTIIYNNAAKGTVYHEAWHHFTQLYLNFSQKQDLYSELKSKDAKYQDMSQRQLEEVLADDFKAYMLTGESAIISRPKSANIFRRILDFIKRIFSGRQTIDRAYRELRKGDLFGYRPNAKNAVFGTLYSGLMNKTSGTPIFDSAKTARYMKYLESVVGRVLSGSNLHPSYLFSGNTEETRSRLNKLYTGLRADGSVGRGVYQFLEDERDVIADLADAAELRGENVSLYEETLSDLDVMLDRANFRHIALAHKDYMGIRTGSTEEDDDLIIDPNHENGPQSPSEDDKTRDNAYDQPGNALSIMQSSSEDTRALIRGLSKVAIEPRTGLPAYDEKGKVRLHRDKFGLTIPVDETNIINRLGTLLESSWGITEMYQRMSMPSNQKGMPELALLLERMPKLQEAFQNDESMQLLGRFARDLGKIYVPIYTLIELKDGTMIFKEETRRTKDTVERKWADTFRNKNINDIEVQREAIVFDKHRRPRINPAIVDTLRNLDFQRNAKDVEDFLALLGISFSALTKETADYRDTVTTRNLTFLRDKLVTRMKMGQVIDNPYRNLTDAYSVSGGELSLGESRTLNAFSELESKYSTETPSLSFRNANGDLRHGLSISAWIFQNNYWLSKVDHIDDLLRYPEAKHLHYKNNPYVLNSVFMNTLFDPATGLRRRDPITKEPITLQIGHYDGAKFLVRKENSQNEDDDSIDAQRNDSEAVGETTTSMSGRTKLLMDFNAFMSAGAIETMRPESASSAFFMKLTSYNHPANYTTDTAYLPIPVEKFINGVDIEEVQKVFYGYFMDELYSYTNLRKSALPNYNDKSAGPGRFSLFKEILESKKDEDGAIVSNFTSTKYDVLDALIETIAKEKKEGTFTYGRISAVYEQTVKTAIKNFLQAEIRAEHNEFVKRGIVQYKDGIMHSTELNPKFKFTLDKAGTAKFHRYISAFVVNDLIMNVEYSKLFSGNVAFYKAFHKRSKADISTGNKPMTDDVMRAYFEHTHNNSMAASLGVAFDNDIAHTQTVVIKDDERASVYLPRYVQALMELNPGMSEEQALATLGFNHKNPKKHGAYYTMNIADGQGQCTLDFYRKFRIQIGNWDFGTDEIAYRKEVVLYRQSKPNLYENLPAGQAERDNMYLEQHKDVVAWFPSIKMQYNGPLDEDGTFAPVNDKFSIAPLLPSVIKGSKWEAMNEEFLRKGISYSKFESGTKKYKWPALDFYGENFETNWNVDINPDDIAHHFTAYLKEQVATKSKPKVESTWGTQMRKLFLANIFSAGVASVNPAKFNRILNSYIDLLNKMQAENKKTLYKDFGINEEGNGTITIKNIQRFADSLSSEVERRELNDNVKDSLEIDPETGNFKWPLEMNLNKAIVQDLISGMLFKKLTQLKINGDMLIQIASSGYESTDFNYTNPSEDEISMYGTNGLKFYDAVRNDKGEITHTSAMTVKIGLTKNWKSLLNRIHTDGNVIGTLERLNALLKDDAWRAANKESISIVGYRIPTQGPNSMDFMEVAEFLPEVAGPVIILPAEIVAKSGSDYDIDKMNVFRPSFTKSGEYISQANIDKLEAEEARITAGLEEAFRKAGVVWSPSAIAHDITPEEISAELDLYDLTQEERNVLDKYIDDLKEMRASRKAMYTNQVMGMYREVLESKEMFTQLITPNSTGLVKPIAEKMAKYKGLYIGDFKDTDIVKHLSNLTKFEQLLSGKRDLAFFAIANTMSQLFQQSGLMLSRRYLVPKDIDNKANTKLTKEEKDKQMLGRKINLKLFSTNERQQVISNGKIDFSKNTNVQGIYKQEYLSQMINSTVDIASDPYYMGLGFNAETLGVAIYLMHMGVPFDRIVLYVSQPIIQHYYATLSKYRDRKMKSMVKYAIFNNIDVEEARDIRVNGGKGAWLLANMENRDNQRADQFFNETIMEDYVKSAGTNVGAWLQSADNTQVTHQIDVFAHFLKLQEQAGILRELQGTITFDTTKFASPLGIQGNLNVRDSVHNSELFDADAVDRIRNHSMISAFNNLELNMKIFQSLMPIGMSPTIVSYSSNLMSKYFANKVSRVKLERVLNNDWIEFIIKNFGEVDGINIETLGKSFIRQYGDTATMAERLGTIRQQYPQLDYFDIFRKLFANFSTKQMDLKNIELYRGLDNSPEFQNVMLENYQALLNIQPNSIPGNPLTEDDCAVIRKFFQDLSVLAFMQAGFNKGMFSFLDVVPHEVIAQTFKDALMRFKQFISQNKEAEESLAHAFEMQFRRQNPTFALNGDATDYNTEPFRGKYYKLDNMRGLIAGAPLSGEQIILSSSEIEDMDAAEDLGKIGPDAPNGETPVASWIKVRRVLNDKDVETFNEIASKLKGRKPQEFFSSTTKFKEFYDKVKGAYDVAPQSAIWVLNERGLYDLVDVDSGTLHISNVDLFTGYQMTDPAIKIEPKPINAMGVGQWTRADVEADAEHMYLFTDNSARTSGNNPVDPDSWYAKVFGKTRQNSFPGATQAVVRGLHNAFPVSTMVNGQREQWADANFDVFKSILDFEFSLIQRAMKSGQFKGIKYSNSAKFGDGQISRMKDFAPKCWAYLNAKLAEIGINNGDINYIESAPAMPIADPTETIHDPATFVNYSGGAKGSDSEWERIGRDFGVGKQVNYRPEDLNRLSPEQYNEVDKAYRTIVKALGRRALEVDAPDPKKAYAAKLVRRDYLQAKAADAIFAISKGWDKNGYVDGGSAYATTAALIMQKPVYVFHQPTKQWFKAVYDTFGETSWESTETPVLTPKFAGIGTREMNADGAQAIRDVYANTFTQGYNPTSAAATTQPDSTSTSKVEVVQPGFGVYKNALTQEEHDKILKYALDQFKVQGYHVKKAVAYAHWGKMWAVNDKGNEGFPVFGKYLRKDANGKINLPVSPITSAESVDNPNAKSWYNYYDTDQNGNALSPIPQEIKDIIKKATGYDVSEHDAAIINAYADATVLTRHIDNTEDTTARGKAIVSINLLNPGKFYFGEGANDSTNRNADNKETTLNPRDIAIFGGASRFMPHRVDVGSGNTMHIDLADGTSGIEARRINITIRRAMPIQKESKGSEQNDVPLTDEFSQLAGKGKEEAAALVDRIYDYLEEHKSSFASAFRGAYNRGEAFDALDLIKDQLYQEGSPRVLLMSMLNDDIQLIDDLHKYFDKINKDTQDRMDDCLG